MGKSWESLGKVLGDRWKGLEKNGWGVGKFGIGVIIAGIQLQRQSAYSRLWPLFFAPPPDQGQEENMLLIGSPATQGGFLFLLRWQVGTVRNGILTISNFSAISWS